jgi:hypothetical protein
MLADVGKSEHWGSFQLLSGRRASFNILFYLGHQLWIRLRLRADVFQIPAQQQAVPLGVIYTDNHL